MQQMIQGEGSIHEVTALLAARGTETIFLVTGKHFLTDNKLVFPAAVTVTHFIKKGSNVEEDEMKEAFLLFEQSGASAIVAIGGGSVMDLAKSLIWQNSQREKNIPFFIAAPTTAGSGSEATSFAVVYRKGKKESLVGSALLPAAVVLDPALTYSLNAYQTAVSGMDVLAQAIESYWNRNANEESQQYASEAIKTWKENFSIALANGNDKTAREKMLYASHLAGKAINITRTTGPHALSYYLTAKFNVPHGHAVALFLPAFFLYNAPQPALYSLLGVNDASAAAAWIRQQMKQAGLAVTLSELGITKEIILDELLAEVNEERFANNPAPFNREQLKKMLSENI